MKAKRNYIIYGLMLAAFAALLLWIVHLGHAYDGLGPGAAPSGEDSPVGLLYDTLTINLKHPLSLLLLQVIAILITVRIFSYLFKYLGQPGVIGEIVAGIVLGPVRTRAPVARDVRFSVRSRFARSAQYHQPDRLGALYVRNRDGA